jgi:predicted O-methyltransferase YrrM
MPILSRILMKYPGNILEFGTGFGSSFLICSICKDYKVLSFESNEEWFQQMQKIGLWVLNDKHSLVYINPHNWDNAYDYINKDIKWNIAFIDHAPGERRVVDIQKLKDLCEIIIFHDSEEKSYGYYKIMKYFKYSYTYKELATWTTIVSNFYPIQF